MEYVSGIKIRDIFLDNGNWWKLFIRHRDLIRTSIIVNVLKMLVCRTGFLGYHLFTCPQCYKSIKRPHSCKSRFCSSCGKKATDVWIKTRFNTLPQTKWQHITFTMDALLWPFFQVNRYLLGKIPIIAATIIKTLANQKGFLPGIFIAMHTFGRDLKWNVHIHLSTTVGGLSLDNDSWVTNGYFYHLTLKKMWKHQILSLFRNEFKAGRLKLPPALKYIKSYQDFFTWTSKLYDKTWVVHLNEQSDNMKRNVEYLGKYLKRPPLGETRIKHYDGSSVSYEYLDHYTNTKTIMQLPVLDFIARLIRHIHDKNFRIIRYYGFLSNRLSGKLLPIVYKLLHQTTNAAIKFYTPWRELLKQFLNNDPLLCPLCNTLLLLSKIVFPSYTLIDMHKEIAHGYFPRL